VALFPGLVILGSVLGFNFLGDGVRDLVDPRMS
jgi:ABC-type dipeptide/oligopeptide/nickel transport system permease subunit